MPQDLSQNAAAVGPLLETARGMTLVDAQLLKEGFRFVFENATLRKVILLKPRVYTDGAVIVDPINDVVVQFTVTTYDAAAYRPNDAQTKPLEETSIELPYSTWFFQGDYR